MVTCPQGTMYTRDDALIAYRLALQRGDRKVAIRQCIDCRAWHLGSRRHLLPGEALCVPAGKKVWRSERAAQDEIKKIKAERAAGDYRRAERFYYRCPYANGCHGWHLTSKERGGR